MKKFVKELEAELNESLKKINNEAEHSIAAYEASYLLIDNALQRLKEYISTYTFEDEAEEIDFFKNIKPLFKSQLIYYLKMHEIETGAPIGTGEELMGYIRKQLDAIKFSFDHHINFYRYYRSGATYLDHKYFVRSNHDFKLGLHTFSSDIDPVFNTTHDYRIALLLANEKLNMQLNKWLDRLETNHPAERKTHTWTDTKVALIELAYAIHSIGAVDNGKADVKDIVEIMETAFNIDLGNYYGVFQQNIRIRKKNRTIYIDQLKEYLNRRMDDQDDNPTR